MRNGRFLAMEAGILAIVGPLTVCALRPLWLRAQSAAPAIGSQAFEVASVKPNKSGDGRIGFQIQPGGRFTATNVPVRELIRMAYGIQSFQLVGGPDWIGSERFDIVAKAESDPPPSPPGGPPGPILMMVRNLLVERFKLAVHNETRDLPIYALVMARADGRLGPQFRASQVDCAAVRAAARGRGGPPLAPPKPGERPPCGMFGGFGRIAAGGVSIAQLAMSLSPRVNRVVLDRTGLTGLYEFELEFTPDQMPQGPPPPGAPPLPPIDPNGPSIFTALQEQLGLKLDAQRGPVEVLIIDGVEQPTPD
jgi:bla regulator protein BlaR1